MKLLTISMLLMPLAVLAQQKDITVYEKKEGQKNIVIARNTGKTQYQVTLNITSTGMNVTPSSVVEAVIPAGHMREMATLVPIPGQSWSYSYEVSYMEAPGVAPQSLSAPEAQSMEEPSSDIRVPSAAVPGAIPDDAIVVYTKPGCGRCTMVKKELSAKGVAFTEVDITGDSPEINTMWKKLRDGGFTGDSVTMPVIRANGKYHYNIPDLRGFVHKL